MKLILRSLRLLLVLTVLTGLLYPLAVWAVGRIFFRESAEGSLVYRQDRLVGSALLAQKNTDPRYFWPRPSAGDYATVASGASNLAWSSAKLAAIQAERRATHSHAATVPADLLTASGGGLDPHLTPAGVQVQTARVARARGLTDSQRLKLDELIAAHLEGGHITPVRINVLMLNLSLDQAFPSP